MKKTKTRHLWLRVLYKVEGVRKEIIIRTLIRSIKRGDYKLPKGWRVVIEWRNKEDAEMRRGEWKEELTASAESSTGFDTAVTGYLERQL